MQHNVKFIRLIGESAIIDEDIFYAAARLRLISDTNGQAGRGVQVQILCAS